MRRYYFAKLALAALAPAACSDSPTGEGGSDIVRTRVEVSFPDVTTSAGLKLCSETDKALLTIRQGGRIRQDTLPVVRRDCVAAFDVSVRKGFVEFTGELLGNDRPLMMGFEEVDARTDAFDVIIPLREIDALTVETKTDMIRSSLPYWFHVDGGDSISIGPNSLLTVGAIAAGSRRITLNARECGQQSQSVEITTAMNDVRLVKFEVKCPVTSTVPSGTIAVVTTTTGDPPTPTSYQVRIDTFPRSLGANATITQVVGIGQRTVQLAGHEGFTHCRLREPNPTTVSVDSAKTSIVRFTVSCADTPPSLKTGGIRIVTRTFGPATPPTKYAVTITAANTNPFTVFLAPNDSTDTSPLLTENNPYTVFLATTKSCEVRGSPSVAVDVPGGGLARVEFTIDCPPKSPSRLPRVPALEPPAANADPRPPPSPDAARRSPRPTGRGSR